MRYSPMVSLSTADVDLQYEVFRTGGKENQKHRFAKYFIYLAIYILLAIRKNTVYELI
jgi:hypothetical protein